MSIYITGDTHIPIDISKLAAKSWEEQKKLTYDDFLIICGDFGGVWNKSNEEKYWLRWLNDKPFTTLFVDGNHENFSLLNQYKTEEFNGGNVHRIMPHIYHLMRGQVFDFNGVRVFTMGGASSHDRAFRKENINWWKEELPSEQEYSEALSNLDKCGWKVDLIITHCASTIIQGIISLGYEQNSLTDFLETIRRNLTYDKWYFGHYHIDKAINNKDTAIYDKIVKY